jgi:hypothetical protein
MADEFTERRRLHENRSATTGLPAVFRVALSKANRPGRLYRIDLIAPSMWRCEVYFGGAIHRTTVVNFKKQMVELKDQYAREVAELLADGWADPDGA